MNPLTWFPLSGLIGYLATAIISVGAAVPFTYSIVHNANKIEIQKLQLQMQKQQAINVQASLQKLQGFIQTMNLAQIEYRGSLDTINKRFGDLHNDFAKLSESKPLPVDCVPGPDRLHHLERATVSANNPTSATP